MGFYANVVFPWILDLTEPKEMGEQRRLLLRDVKGEILEIGLGSGANLPFYPDTVKALTAVEPSAGMQSRARQRAEASGRTVQWHQVKGERLPFGDAKYDTVVIVDVLCSVDDVDAVVNEAYRVLKPGGRLHLLDHGLARVPSLQKWQYRLNGWSKALACGCNLMRDLEKHIRKSRFLIEDFVFLPPFSGMNALYTHIRVIATKPR